MLPLFFRLKVIPPSYRDDFWISRLKYLFMWHVCDKIVLVYCHFHVYYHFDDAVNNWCIYFENVNHVSLEKPIMLSSALVSKMIRGKGYHIEFWKSFKKPCPFYSSCLYYLQEQSYSLHFTSGQHISDMR